MLSINNGFVDKNKGHVTAGSDGIVWCEYAL